MATSKRLTVDQAEQIDPPEKEPGPKEEEQAAWDWFFDVAFPHLAPPDPFTECPHPFQRTQCLEDEFETLCDAAQEASC